MSERATRRFIAVGMIVFIAFVAVRNLSAVITDSWWFATVEQRGTWRRLSMYRYGVAAVTIVATFVLVWANLAVADRARRRAPLSDPTRSVRLNPRYAQLVEGRTRGLRLVTAAVVTAMAAPTLAGSWQEVALFTHRRSFEGFNVSRLGANAGFFVFTLPLLSAVTLWVIVAAVMTFAATAASYYLNGSLDLSSRGRIVSRHAGIHLGALAALVSAGVAAALWWSRYSLAR